MAKQNTGGFDGLSGSGMAPLTPTMNNNLIQQSSIQSMKPTSNPVFSSQPQNLMFGVQPLSLQNNQNNKNNPFSF